MEGGPVFSEFDLAALASDLDSRERQMMMRPDGGHSSGDFLSAESHNVSLGGDFSIQVLQKALEVWDLQVIPLDSPVAGPAQIDPDLENAFICHLHDHWFSIRKVNGEWYNFDSLYAAPQHLSKFYLAAYMDSLKSSGWSIFLVRGNFPKEFPIPSSEASNGYGQWLSPEDAERITKSCNSTKNHQRRNPTQKYPYSYEDMLLGMEEDEDLKAAIAASLMESSQAIASAESGSPQRMESAKTAASLLESSLVMAGVGSGTPQKMESSKIAANLPEPSRAMANAGSGSAQKMETSKPGASDEAGSPKRDDKNGHEKID
ncbi:hypothetical protein Tsubulata_012590 [Turnera subulata]|uniref:ubiquitinyl hydrolase 1 n=1 Tax=Turnera subulata TaxID=218843 RepID=A0A9Q0FQC0_9ROSI|nr:hypothetical protein Tsubulata_012590 [Turnera subulata]